MYSTKYDSWLKHILVCLSLYSVSSLLGFFTPLRFKFIMFSQRAFTHRFFKQIARFCKRKRDWQIDPIALLSWATGANRSRPLFCKEWQERFAQDPSFVKSDESDWAKRNGNDSLLSIKRGKAVKSCQKHEKNMNRANRWVFLKMICSNHGQANYQPCSKPRTKRNGESLLVVFWFSNS